MNFLLKATSAMLLLVPVAACGSQAGPEPNGDPSVAVSKEPAPDPGNVSTLSGGGTCCQYGKFTCPIGHVVYEYNQVGCGPTKPVQQQNCYTHCFLACTDSGWITGGC